MSSSEGTSGIDDDDDDEYFYDIEDDKEFDNDDEEDDGVDDDFSDNVISWINQNLTNINNIHNNNNNQRYYNQQYRNEDVNNEDEEEEEYEEEEEEEYEYENDSENQIDESSLASLLSRVDSGPLSLALNSYFMNYLTNNFNNGNNSDSNNMNNNNNNNNNNDKEPIDIKNEKIYLEYLSRVKNESFNLNDYLIGREMYGKIRNENILLSNHYLPNDRFKEIANIGYKIFCCKLSNDGKSFMTASQDKQIRFFNTDTWKEKKTITARNINWSIIDTDFSSDQNYLIYSSWSPYIQFCKINKEEQEDDYHVALDLDPNQERCCVFSLKFSPDNNEILAGSIDGNICLYDLVEKKKILDFRGHSDDVNTVCYVENLNSGNSGNIFATGSDDSFIKIWDKRILSKSSTAVNNNGRMLKPVGSLSGHYHGLTHLESKGDGIYLLSNSKDHSAKLWDIRKMSTGGLIPAMPPNEVRGGGRYSFSRFFSDYRTRPPQPPSTVSLPKSKGDVSLMTYVGHSVEQTLIRCHFSPTQTTAQKYIYSGSFTGDIYIYETLTGEIVQILRDGRGTIRDLSWSPFSQEIISTNWSGFILKWDQFADQRDHFNFNSKIQQ